MINNNKIIVLTGFSGAGKDTIAENIQALGFHFIKSHTTRPIRKNESERKSYWFIDNKTFHKMKNNNEFIEYRFYNTLVDGNKDIWYYATAKSEIKDDKKYIIVLDMLGLIQFKKIFGNRVIGIFIHTPNKIREERAKLRGSFSQTEWDRRLSDDVNSFPKKMIKNKCDFIIENILLDKAIKDILNILNLHSKPI